MSCSKNIVRIVGATALSLGLQSCGQPENLNLASAQPEVGVLASTLASKSFALAELGAGKTYYVDLARGADTNAGTSLTAPLKTLAKAASLAVAGDTVYIRAGTYRERLAPRNSGNSTSGYITFSAYNNEAVTLDGTGLPTGYNGMVDMNNRAYIQVMGLKAVNYDYFGISAQNSNHIKILGNSTFNTGRSGIFSKNNDTITIDGNEISQSNLLLNQESLTITDSTTNFVVSNNIVHGGKMEGIDVKSGSNNGKVIGNTVYDIARIGIYVDGFQSGVHDVIIEGNIVRDPTPAATTAGLDAIRIGAEAGGLVNNITIRNNVVYGAKAAGIMLPKFHHADAPPPRYSNISIINNTIYGNGTLDAGGITVQDCGCTGIVIANNILSENNRYSIKVDAAVQPQVTVTHNLIDKPDGQRVAENEIFGTAYVTGDPLFIDAAQRNFRLKSTSPAIDRASSSLAPASDLDGTLRPQGSGDDMGAFEYVVAAPSPTPSPSSSPVGDTQAPTNVAITSPTNGSPVPANTWLKITASAKDNVGVAKVEIYVNSALKCTQLTAPYTCGFTVPTGAGKTYNLKAKAFDAAGNYKTSSVVSVTSR